MGKLVLVLGGARSGKSSYAERRARQAGGDHVLYVATSEVHDEEMRTRVAKHREQRPKNWQTLEAPMYVAQAIRNQKEFSEKVVLLDCLTLLISNHLLASAGPKEDAFGELSGDPFATEIEAGLLLELDELLQLVDVMEANFIVVSNEVGLGLVPPYELGRAYRDMLGRANQIVAKRADEVLFMVAGIPMTIK